MKFYLTFGQKYRDTPHEVRPDLPIHPDGYYTVEAESEEQAREWAFEIFGDKWSHMRKEVDETYFPRGSIGLIKEGKIINEQTN